MQNFRKEMKSCYKGAFQVSWDTAISDLVYFIQEILPKVTTMGNFNTLIVHPDFPAFQRNPTGEEIFEYRRITEQTCNALDLFSSELDKIIIADANEREMFVLSNLNGIKKILLILTKRIEVYDKFLITLTDSRNIGEVAYSGDTALAGLLHSGTTDQSLKNSVVEKILNQHHQYFLLKAKWEASAAIFEQASNKLAMLENLFYNEHFNENSFLNYNRYKKEIAGFMRFQGIHWGEMFNYLHASNTAKVKPFILKTGQAHIRQADISNTRTSPLLPSNIIIADITNTNIITHSLAELAGCIGQPIQIRYTPVYGGEDHVATTMLYNLEVKTPGNSIYIQAFGTSTPICRSKQSSDEWIKRKSSELDLNPSQILNEELTVELLIGTRNATAHHQADLLSTKLQEKVIIISPEEFEKGSPINYFNIQNKRTIL